MHISIFEILIYFLLLEIFFFIVFKVLKKDFQWLIDENDENPLFSKSIIKKYNSEIFDKFLGWDNKKNKKKIEISLKKKKLKFEYNFDKEGSRLTGNNFKKNNITFFGDSYAFCRCSQDNQTIQHYLEKKTKSKISNFGVGNYGLDQAFLKIKKKKKSISKVKNIIIIFVPETITRVHSYWKHFIEFGNILGFKPKFEMRKNKIVICNEHLSKLDVNSMNKKLNFLKKKDIFYKKKFLKNKFKFSYLFSFMKNLNKNLEIFYYLILGEILKSEKYKEKAFGVVVKNNLIESQQLYLKEDYNKLLENIIIEINRFLKKKKKNIFFFIVPQLFDLKIDSSSLYSKGFFDSLSKRKNLNLFDLTNDLSKTKEIEKLYIDDFYGGHLNYKGNKLVASIIFKKIKKFI